MNLSLGLILTVAALGGSLVGAIVAFGVASVVALGVGFAVAFLLKRPK